MRDDLGTCYKRLIRQEIVAQDETIVLSDGQIQLLERHPREFRMRHVEANAVGELLNQDPFYSGTLEGVGEIYIRDARTRNVVARRGIRRAIRL